MGTLPSEYSAAIRSVRTAKNVFWILMALAILAQLVVFGLVAWGRTVDVLYGPPVAASRPATAPASDKLDGPRRVVEGELPVAAVGLAVRGHGHGRPAGGVADGRGVRVPGGAAGRGGVAAQRVLLVAGAGGDPDSLAVRLPAVAASPARCSTTTNCTLAPWRSRRPGAPPMCRSGGLVLYHVRFLAYPILAMLIWLLVNLKFRRGRREMVVTAAEPLSP